MKTAMVVIVTVLVAFIWQLQVCFSHKTIKKKRLPALVLLAMIAGLAAFAVIGTWLYEQGWPIYSAPYGAAIFAILLLIPLAGVVLGWGIHGIVRKVQNNRK